MTESIANKEAKEMGNEVEEAEAETETCKSPNENFKDSKLFFGLRKGRTTSSCIFLLENDFKEQIDNCATAEYSMFSTMHEAVQYIESDPSFIEKSMKRNTDRVTTDKGNSDIIGKDTDGHTKKESWEGMFIQLMYYHRTHNNTLVPSYCQKLYTWVIDQLKQYDNLKKGLPHSLTMGRVQLLLGLNFDFNRLIIPADHSNLTNGNIAENHEKEKELIHNNKKTSVVPILPTPGNDNTSAINAVTTNNSQDLNSTRMTKTTIASQPMYQPPPVIFPFPSPYFPTFVAPPWPINNVPTNSGFYQHPQIMNTSPDQEKSPTKENQKSRKRHREKVQKIVDSKASRQEKYDEKWNSMCNDLLKFKNEHGHLNVDFSTDLGKWCLRQRELYTQYKKNEGPLTDERVRQLKDIGIDFTPYAKKNFYSNIDELKKYKEEHGNYLFPRKSWLSRVVERQKRDVSKLGSCFDIYHLLICTFLVLM